MTETLMRTEWISPVPAESLAGLLGVEDPSAGGTVPELWHWVYLLERRPEGDLGPDGHPTSGIPAPPGRGRRRMFAGGRVQTHQLLRFGEEAVRTWSLVDTVVKQGRQGPLTFVTVRNEIRQGGELAIVDEQDIVYREPGGNALATIDDGALPEREASLELQADERLLFRFSALTYNTHRIHYDAAWCAYEGYDGLVVHGPLQAMLLGELYRRNGVSLVGKEFAYRLVSPMVGTQTVYAMASADGLGAGAESMTGSGRVTATAHLSHL